MPLYLTERGKGARCATFNAEVGGHPKSRHLRGEAADFFIDGVSAQDVQVLLRRWYPDKLGIGRGQSFTHVDTWPNAASWNY